MKRYTWRLIAVSSSLTLLTTPALASELPIDWRNAVTDYVTGAMTDLGAPGAAVVIVDSDGVLFSEGFGVTARGGDPVTPLTPFHLASVSKALTGLAVMQLIEGGRLDLNTHTRAIQPWAGLGETSGLRGNSQQSSLPYQRVERIRRPRQSDRSRFRY